MPQVREARRRLRFEAVVDPGPATFAAHNTGLAQHLQVMRDGGLADPATIREVARADLTVGSELLNDREPRGLCESLENLHVIHAGHYIDQLRY